MSKIIDKPTSSLYADAVETLKNACCKEELLQAQEIFLTMDAVHDCAGLFAVYCSALADICESNGDMAIEKLNMLAQRTVFSAKLKKHRLPSIGALQSLISDLDFGELGLHWTAYESMSSALREGSISPSFLNLAAWRRQSTRP